MRDVSAAPDAGQALAEHRRDVFSGRASDVPSEMVQAHLQGLDRVANNLKSSGPGRLVSEIAEVQALAEALSRHSVLSGGGQ